ncbi:apolipoprotein N-acyltransferase [Shimia thalassica]|uniref:apolipoprotein N-acyltransferase n=1 Tax=Shimia thalassica TaxID=1715693 RepID=UPI001C094E92|nr:apolipoprotein N-acyltransferase [Shimia thalassica]MBU2942971.1 apolipoprotein N-acyltransferase [Shimia thalassica]MDO6502706.1 apolipoprotein N-acyltransferase [Shimia thalassica]
MAEQAPVRWWAARSRWQQLALTMLFGAIAALGHAPFNLPILTLVGLALGFAVFAASQTPAQALWRGLALGTGYFAVSLNWIVEPFLVDIARHGWMAPFALVFLASGLSLFWGAAFWGAYRLRAGVLGLAVLLAGAEMLRAYVFTGFPWAMPAYVLVNSITGQLAAVVGSHGLNLLLFCGVAACAIAGRHKIFVALGIVAITAVLWPVSQSDLASEGPVVRLVQPNAPQHQKWDPALMPVFFQRGLAATKAGPVRPDLIVWPETAVPVALNYADSTLAAMSDAASGVPVVFGVNRFDGERIYNSAGVLAPDGSVSQIYDKHHLVPFGEYIPLGDMLARIGIHGMAARNGKGFSAGPGPELLDLGALGRALPLICYEVVFPQDVLSVSERPDFLLQLTNDAWFGNFSGPYQHLQQARMRAIETGLPLIRAANTGVSAVVDPKGRLTAQLALNTAGHLDAVLPSAQPQTLYARSGDLPLGGGLVMISILLLWRSRVNSD